VEGQRTHKWDGSNFLSDRLSDPLAVANRAQSLSVTAGTAAKLVTGGVAGQSGNAGQFSPCSSAGT
jgi:hypothetical protein